MRAIIGSMTAKRLLRAARRRAGLTQRQLAARSGIPQTTIARIEGGDVDPRFGTLVKLLRSCDCDLETTRLLGRGVDRLHIRANLELTPAERLSRVSQEAAALAALRGIARPPAAGEKGARGEPSAELRIGSGDARREPVPRQAQDERTARELAES